MISFKLWENISTNTTINVIDKYDLYKICLRVNELTQFNLTYDEKIFNVIAWILYTGFKRHEIYEIWSKAQNYYVSNGNYKKTIVEKDRELFGLEESHLVDIKEYTEVEATKSLVCIYVFSLLKINYDIIINLHIYLKKILDEKSDDYLTGLMQSVRNLHGNGISDVMTDDLENGRILSYLDELGFNGTD